MILTTILVFAIILGLLIFVHELGHFVMAKRAGMKVEEFGFGFPPRLFGIRRGETIYSINWIPLGGFVKIAGEDGGDNPDPRAFSNKGFFPRLIVLLAGVAMNFVLAWFLFFLGFSVIGTPVEVGSNFNNAGVRSIGQTEITVISVQPDTPAAQAGFHTGDMILNINGLQFESIDEMIVYTESIAGSKAAYEISRGGETVNLDVVPRKDYPEGSGPVGFMPARIAQVKYHVWPAFKLSLFAFVSRFWAILSAFGMLFAGLFRGQGVSQSLSGPVGIAVLTRDFTRLGLPYLLQFTAVLSINLAIINAIPFPALDGGRVLFLLIEKIRGVKSIIWEQRANLVGFLLLLLLMVVITFHDVSRFSEQFKNLFSRFM